MKENHYRFYGGLLAMQENWLNQMAAKGMRLTGVGKLRYEFTPCDPGQYQYRVEFIGEKSRENAEDYAHFLEDCGYRVFFKNINLNYSVGKVTWRPWAEPGGRLATNATTYGRELLIVEKEADGQPFQLHTSYEDQLRYCRNRQKPWLCWLAVAGALGLAMGSWVWGAFALAALIPLTVLAFEARKLGQTGEDNGVVSMKAPNKPFSWIFLIAAIILACWLAVEVMGIGSFRSGLRLGYFENAGRERWSAHYTMMDGSAKRTLRLKDPPRSLRIDAVTESGQLSIEILDTDGNVIFREEDLGTGAYEAEVPGRVSVRVVGKRHKGSFSIACQEK